ncbi:MAG: protein-methionine-sulfoxide reductase catalytic subunit MsrP [Bryobacteraceae bacterium]|nr:protein-methionine-sulfoxide reductase catalytic subunit MsrP [Bryobacterales bacterium]MEB2363365.1 protein-methionine-sulfoxide reductase catalytic subunit MsrP [Bryobacterales bacterium]NUN02353.1 protein-methionine-sulfoxide reductase catalytic subunit MsrP [Bryobacteraceae bacterium]
MLIGKAGEIRSSEITPRDVYFSRRKFLAGGVGLAVGAGALRAAAKLEGLGKSPFSTTEKLTPYDAVTTYNNFYEFGSGKDQPARFAKNFQTVPWTVSVEGHAQKPRTFDLDSILALAPIEERIYRMRCVEGWSMVIPWAGYPLSTLLKQVEPLSKARYVAFQSYYNSKQMPQARFSGIPFPYVEGLRMDEAMHPLTLLCVGLYGERLPNQNGAPVRIVVPWKYGFKSIKSIAKIKLVEKEPPITWNLANPREYGFYSNVNPKVDHPRWSQAKERRIGEFFKRDTLLFNGYGDSVSSLYAGMDLKKYY